LSNSKFPPIQNGIRDDPGFGIKKGDEVEVIVKAVNVLLMRP
jgi:hypothetical protein